MSPGDLIKIRALVLVVNGADEVFKADVWLDAVVAQDLGSKIHVVYGGSQLMVRREDVHL